MQTIFSGNAWQREDYTMEVLEDSLEQVAEIA